MSNAGVSLNPSYGGPVGTFALVDSTCLRPHEQVDEDRLERLAQEIARDGVLREPVLVDSRSLVILDGHHRVQVLRSLGCNMIPVYLVDYYSPAVQVRSWREGVRVDKDSVLQRGLSQTPFPPRTSRHTVSVMLPPRPVSLSLLIARL
ncbi:MAG: ParB N-terminal domain-containing protein [Bacillota bacterium]